MHAEWRVAVTSHRWTRAVRRGGACDGSWALDPLIFTSKGKLASSRIFFTLPPEVMTPIPNLGIPLAEDQMWKNLLVSALSDHISHSAFCLQHIA